MEIGRASSAVGDTPSAQDMGGLAGNKKLERLHIQQNSIQRIGDAFKHMTKLRDVRLDRNKLASVEGLGACSSLRVLDLSYNQIAALDGLAGLQSLEELKINNNAVKSLRPLKGLPSLREIDCSYNGLKSLDGIQFLPVLEVVHAEHNQVYTLQLGGDGAERTMSRSSSEGPADSVKANRLNEMTNALKESRKGSSGSLSGPSLKPKGKSKPTEEKHLNIVELHMRGNRLKDLAQLTLLGHSIEVLDVSNNEIAAAADVLAQQLNHLHKLAEIRIDGNPALMAQCVGEDESRFVQLHDSLVRACPSLRNVDTCAVVGGRVVSAMDSSSARDEATLRIISVIETTLNIENDNSSIGSGSKPVLNADGTISHTWVSRGEASTVLDEMSAVDPEGSSSEEEDEGDRAEEAAPKVKPSGQSIDETMLTEQQIEAIESSFTSLLHQCRDRLNALPRPPTKGEGDEDEDIPSALLSSVYTDLGGRSIGIQPIVTETGRRTSKNLSAQDERARALRDSLLSPPAPPNPRKTPVRIEKEYSGAESSTLVSPVRADTNDKSVMTTASSLVTNVLMYTSPANKEGPKKTSVQRSNSLKDINVDAFARKEGIEDT